jgi:ACS family glucarate transporter-like MFS transporter
MLNILRGRVRWILVFWIFIISAVAYLDRVNISIAGQFIQQELKLSNTELGWVFSAFVLGYALSQAPAGRFADRIGPRKALTVGAIWWGIFTALSATVSGSLAQPLLALVSIRFVLGVGEAIMYPSSNRFVASWIPTQERGKANGIIFAGVGAGAGLAPPLITYLIVHYGWRSSFWVSAAIGLVVGAVWYLLARDETEELSWLGKEEAAHIHAGLPDRKKLAGAQVLSWRTILSDKDVLLLTFSYFCYGYTAYIFFTWFFIYLNKVKGLDLKSSSLYSMLPFIAMALGSPLGGWISDHLTRRYGKRIGRCGLAVGSMALAAFFVALATQVDDARFASLVLAGGAGAVYLSASSFWSVTADMGGASAGSVSGVMNMGCQIGGTITASLTPYIAERFGWSSSFLVAAALCASGALAWLLVDPERKLVSPPYPVNPPLSTACR